MVKLVGILNITPDSFSDGGKYFDTSKALYHTKELLKDGADIIDIGAESTRPNAKILSDKEEWSRLKNTLPQIICEIKNFNQQNSRNVKISIDSYHFNTIKRAYELGIDIINDVSGLVNEDVIKFIAQNKITTILMHNLAIHSNPNLIVNQHLNINHQIIKWGRKKIKILNEYGVNKQQLIFDPGIGFSKNATQSIQILKNINYYRILELPLYIGHSMKSFLNSIDLEGDLKTKTLTVSKFLINKVDYLRVHDVASHKEIMPFSNFKIANL
jgi:dihydropteroate synthase